MKQWNLPVWLFLLLTVCLALVGCQGEPKPPVRPQKPSVDMTVVADGVTEYVIVYDGSNAGLKRANELINNLHAWCGVDRMSIKKVEDSKSDSVYEILVGSTDRVLSRTQQLYVGQPTDDFLWSIATDDTRLSLNANSDLGWQRLYEELQTMVEGGDLVVKSNVNGNSILTLEAYEEELRQAELAALEKLREELAQRVPGLIEKIGDFDIAKDFGGTAITPMATGAWSAPAVVPEEGQHPRLFFTKDDIPAINAYLKSDESFNSTFLQQVKADINEGVLPMATIKSNGVYNYDANILSRIQAKALYYQLTGIEYYGYEAILSIKNYISTLGIGYFNSDQCRYFGNTVYITACVYDWCYDLMTDEDKLQIQVGVENKLLKGNSGCDYLDAEGVKQYCNGNTVPGGPVAQANKAKMEIGFPPNHSGALFGHNSEYQLLRDYMSFAAAIYDEEPSWWAYCGGRYYQQYYPARQFFYSEEAAIYPEGTAVYGPWRFICDMYAVWMIYSMTGEVIYGEGLHQVPYSFLEHETLNKGMFGTADGRRVTLTSDLGSGALMVSYLFGDDVLFTNAAYTGVGLYVAERAILSSAGQTMVDDRTVNFDNVQYNAGHYGQIIARQDWSGDKTTAVVLMKGAGLGNGGHDHNDQGSFQIYYKGFLTTEDGVYDTWGSQHHFYYHVATVAHNSVLVYNPTYQPHPYYNGGQRHLMSSKPNGRETVEQWRDHPSYVMGVTTGMKDGYYDDGTTRFVYYANDLTSAYYSQAVSYYSRTMLVTYPEDHEDVPMIMFVYDNIEGASADYQKTFLLQSVKEPVIDEAAGTVTIVNGDGKLVLKNLLGGDRFAAYGGDSGDDPDRFWLSGIDKNLASGGGLSSGGSGNNANAWGHVEIQPNKGNKTDHLLNVLYVTDSDKSPDLTIRSLSGVGCIGAMAEDQVAIFATSKTATSDTLTITTVGLGRKSYYVGNIAAGTWQVSIGGSVIDTFTVTEAEQMLTFEAKSGKVEIKRLT